MTHNGDKPASVLLIEDSSVSAMMVEAMLLEGAGIEFGLHHVESLSDGLDYLGRTDVDCILLDLSLPDADGLTAVVKVRESVPDIPIVVLSGRDDEELAVEAVRQGAQDYLIKGRVDTHVMGRAIRHAIERNRIEREADSLKDEFLALVSHELRTPLTSIIGYQEVIQNEDGDKLSERSRHALEVIDRNSTRLLRLVGDLLFIAQVKAGKLELDLQPVDMTQLARDCAESARPAAAKKSITVETAIEPVPASAGDRDRLGQVIDNLLSNAIKFTPEGGCVELKMSQTSHDRAMIEVSDSGIGIPEDEQAAIFDRLFRASTATEHAIPGVGLGLTISKAIVEGHDGFITVESEEGKGTTLRIDLPLRPVPKQVWGRSERAKRETRAA